MNSNYRLQKSGLILSKKTENFTETPKSRVNTKMEGMYSAPPKTTSDKIGQHEQSLSPLDEVRSNPM